MKNKKQELIDIALKAFLEKGFANIPLKEIAKTAGIRQASIFYHFESKQALFEACTVAFFEKWGIWMDALVSRSGTLKELIYESCMSLGMDNELVYELYGAETKAGQYQFFLDIAAIYPEAFEHLNISNQAYRQLLELKITEAKSQNEISTDTDPETVYLLLGCLMEGSNIMRFTDPELDIGAYCESLFNVFWKGIS